MKLIATLCLFIVTTFLANAQSTSPGFEQTVDYIVKNTKGRVMYPGDLDDYSRVKGYHLKDIKIQKDGRIELITDQKYDNNDFTIAFNLFDLVEKVDYPSGIRAYKFLVRFNGLNVSSGYGITFATDADAQKVARAFRHLKTLCVKSDDLFSKIPDEEKKPKLSREETVKYINNLLSNVPLSQKAVNIGYSAKPIKRHTIVYRYPTTSMQYNHDSKKYTVTVNVYYRDYDLGRHTNMCCALSTEHFMENYVITFSAKDITDIEEDWDGYFVRDNKKEQIDEFYHPVWGHNTTYKMYYKYFRVKFASGGSGIIRHNGTEPKFTSRLKNAFLRLKELDKDEVDPFD